MNGGWAGGREPGDARGLVRSCQGGALEGFWTDGSYPDSFSTKVEPRILLEPGYPRIEGGRHLTRYHPGGVRFDVVTQVLHQDIIRQRWDEGHLRRASGLPHVGRRLLRSGDRRVRVSGAARRQVLLRRERVQRRGELPRRRLRPRRAGAL